jgi:hypothetical protein
MPTQPSGSVGFASLPQRTQSPMPATRQVSNRLFATYLQTSSSEYRRSRPRWRSRKGPLSSKLALPTHVYFPCSGLLSLQTMTQDGNSVEVAMSAVNGSRCFPPLLPRLRRTQRSSRCPARRCAFEPTHCWQIVHDVLAGESGRFDE